MIDFPRTAFLSLSLVKLDFFLNYKCTNHPTNPCATWFEDCQCLSFSLSLFHLSMPPMGLGETIKLDYFILKNGDSIQF